MEKKKAISVINASMGREKCDMKISNAKIVDVYSGNIFEGSVYIKDGIIAETVEKGDYGHR